jgi:hypothetical protein
MKKLIGIVPLFALVLPFAAGAVYLESDATGGASAGNSGATGGAQIQLQVEGENGKPATVTQDVDEDGTPIFHIMTGADASVSSESDDSMAEDEIKSSISSEEKVKVEVKDNGTVEIKSKHKGKFLGFLPVTFTVRTDVEKQENGSLTARVNLPWWGFLISGAAKVQADIEALVHANVNAGAAVDVSNSVKSSLEMEAQAQ